MGAYKVYGQLLKKEVQLVADPSNQTTCSFALVTQD